MHREIQIKQFPIVTTHWWPKTRNERFVWENEQYLYRFLPLVHNHVQVIWVRTHPVCDVCVRALARRRQRLTEGVSEAWCWRAVIVTTTNHILLWYLHEAIWLADASVGAWKVVSAPRFRHVHLFPSYRDGHLYLPLYDWQTRTVWPKNIKIGSTEEKKTPTSWMSLG